VNVEQFIIISFESYATLVFWAK